jgi:formate-dependent nitrite reductase membrane component NrfD
VTARDASATAARTPGARSRGRGEQRMVPPARPDSYYGRPILKEPVWTWEIPLYFFSGGLAGASAALGFGAGLAGNDVLARRAWAAAFGGIAASPALLVSDLGRPKRFLNMLRVFKPTSPMSMGSWLLSASGAAIGVAASHEILGWFPPRVGRTAGAAAALLGLPLTSYTAALVANTAVPVWHEARHELPFMFGGSAMASAGAVASMLTPASHAGPARRLTLAGAIVEGTASQVMQRRLGDLAAPYHSGTCGRLSRVAKTLTAAGALATCFGGRRDRRVRLAGGAAAVAGAALERWAVFRAGFQSARDPKYTVEPQLERAGERRPSQR